jgi:predicted RNA polymerase sigma factor
MGVLTGLPDLLRELAPQVLAAVMRRYGDFEACEDAVDDELVLLLLCCHPTLTSQSRQQDQSEAASG